MKNMFFVINKEKIYAYVVSIMTIVTIFFMSSLINSDLKETEVTSSNSIENSFGKDTISINSKENNAIEDAVSTSTPYEANTNTEEENESNNFSDKNTVQMNENNNKKNNN